MAVVGTALAFGVLQGFHTVRNRSYRETAPICRVQTGQPIVALTFDDGPDPVYTPQALSLMAEFDFSATFFVVGRRAEQFPGLVEQEVRAGMEIGDHTSSHPHLSQMSAGEVRLQVTHPAQQLAETGAHLRFFRAPYGEISADQLAIVRSLGLTTAHWSVALDHYVDDGTGLPEQIGTKLARDIRPGDIILAHDARIQPSNSGGERGVAMSTLRSMLTVLQRRGFEVTTLGALLAEGSAVVLAQPRPWFWQTGFTCPDPRRS